MTYRQEIILQKVREHIHDLRNMLDDLLYGQESNTLSDVDRRKIRDAYDLICNANDKL